MVWTGYKTVKYQVICTSFISVQNYRVTFANLVVKPVFISRHLCSICTAQWTIRLSLHFMQTQPCPLLRTDFKFSSETSPSENIGRRVYWIASTRPFSLLRFQLLVLLHCPWKNIFFTSAVTLLPWFFCRFLSMSIRRLPYQSTLLFWFLMWITLELTTLSTLWPNRAR